MKPNVRRELSERLEGLLEVFRPNRSPEMYGTIAPHLGFPEFAGDVTSSADDWYRPDLPDAEHEAWPFLAGVVAEVERVLREDLWKRERKLQLEAKRQARNQILALRQELPDALEAFRRLTPKAVDEMARRLKEGLKNEGKADELISSVADVSNLEEDRSDAPNPLVALDEAAHRVEQDAEDFRQWFEDRTRDVIRGLPLVLAAAKWADVEFDENIGGVTRRDLDRTTARELKTMFRRAVHLRFCVSPVEVLDQTEKGSGHSAGVQALVRTASAKLPQKIELTKDLWNDLETDAREAVTRGWRGAMRRDTEFAKTIIVAFRKCCNEIDDGEGVLSEAHISDSTLERTQASWPKSNLEKLAREKLVASLEKLVPANIEEVASPFARSPFFPRWALVFAGFDDVRVDYDPETRLYHTTIRGPSDREQICAITGPPPLSRRPLHTP